MSCQSGVKRSRKLRYGMDSNIDWHLWLAGFAVLPLWVAGVHHTTRFFRPPYDAPLRHTFVSFSPRGSRALDGLLGGTFLAIAISVIATGTRASMNTQFANAVIALAGTYALLFGYQVSQLRLGARGVVCNCGPLGAGFGPHAIVGISLGGAAALAAAALSQSSESQPDSTGIRWALLLLGSGVSLCVSAMLAARAVRAAQVRSMRNGAKLLVAGGGAPDARGA